MTNPTILITGATGRVGGQVAQILSEDPNLNVKVAIRKMEQSSLFESLNATPVYLDFDEPTNIDSALVGVDQLMLLTGYTVDMMKHSKRVIDAAKRQGVKHIVHIGASGAETAEVAHWGWHHMIEAYIEQQGFSYTHLQPEAFMQNLTGFNWLFENTLTNLIGNARWSWVDAYDVAALAAEALRRPKELSGQTWRLGYSAATMQEVASMLTKTLGKTIRVIPMEPVDFYDAAVASGGDPAYLACIRDQFELNRQDLIADADQTFDAEQFYSVVGRMPTTWHEYIERDFKNQ